MSKAQGDGSIIESIEGKRTSHGYTEYYVKWMNQSRKKNSWERADCMECGDMIAEYESKRKHKKVGATRTAKKLKVCVKRKPVEAVQAVKAVQAAQEPLALGCELEVEKILGATDVTGELMFLVEWKNTQERELVPAKVANLRWPQLVIKFYEDRLKWQLPTTTAAATDLEDLASAIP